MFMVVIIFCAMLLIFIKYSHFLNMGKTFSESFEKQLN